MPRTTLTNASGSDRPWRRMITSLDERKSTTTSVTTVALSSTGTYQVRGNVASGKSAPRTETSRMAAAASKASRPRPPIRFRRPTARPLGTARTGGIDIGAICVARPKRKVKELSQVVTKSYSVHQALYALLYGAILEQGEEGRLVEDRDLQPLSLLELGPGVGALHEVIRLLGNTRADGTAEGLDPFLGFSPGQRVQGAGQHERFATERPLAPLRLPDLDPGREETLDEAARLRPLEVLVDVLRHGRAHAADGPEVVHAGRLQPVDGSEVIGQQAGHRPADMVDGERGKKPQKRRRLAGCDSVEQVLRRFFSKAIQAQ